MMCCAVFVGVGYYYIDANLKPVQNETENVPYSQESPENAGVLLEIGGDKTFFYLDFESEKLFVSVMPEEVNGGEIYGYSVDYTVSANYQLLSDIVDYVGGIEMTLDDTVLRYTGIQVSELAQTNTGGELKREIIAKICEIIEQSGVALDFFANIIETADTDLTIPDCYFWEDKIDTLCQNLQIID